MSNWFKQNQLIAYFIIAYAVSWSVEIPIALSYQGIVPVKIPMWIHYFASFGPMTAALILTALIEGREGIRDLVARIFKWRVDVRYYLFAILAPIGLFAFAYLLNPVNHRFDVVTAEVVGFWADFSWFHEKKRLKQLL